MGTKRPVKRGILDSLGREIGYKQPEASAVEFDQEEYLNSLGDLYSEENADEESISDTAATTPGADKLTDEERAWLEALSNVDANSIEKATDELLDNLPDKDLKLAGEGSLGNEEAVVAVWDSYKDFDLGKDITDKVERRADVDLQLADYESYQRTLDSDMALMFLDRSYDYESQFDHTDDGFKQSFQELVRLTQATSSMSDEEDNPFGYRSTQMKTAAMDLEFHDKVHTEHSEKFHSLNSEFDALLARGDREAAEEVAAKLYAEAQEAIPAYTTYLASRELFDNYLIGSMRLARAVSNRAKESGFFTSTDVDSFGSLRKVDGTEKREKFAVDGMTPDDIAVLFSDTKHTNSGISRMWLSKVNDYDPRAKMGPDETFPGRKEAWKGALGVNVCSQSPGVHG